MRIDMTTRTRLATASALLTVLAVAGSVHAQFAPPTCVPPFCNPEVIQNIDADSGTAQVADINITGDAKLGAKLQIGANAPVMTQATENLYYGNVSGGSTNGSLILLQFGLADRLRVSLAGQMQLPPGSAGAPSYTFLGDTNTGLYSSAADTLQFVTNGTNQMTIGPAGAVTVPGSLTVQGAFTSSGGLGGDGSALTNLNATNITSGTLNDARLSTNVATYTGGGTFTGVNSFTNAGNSFTGNGSGLTSLNASNISSGTLNDARLSSNVALLNRANQNFTGNNNFAGMVTAGSAALPVIGAQNLIYGNVDSTSTGALLLLQNESVDRFRVAADGAVTATSFSGVGTGLTALNASNLSSGTVPSARLSGTYANSLTFSNRTNFGSASLNVAGGQHLIYGNMDAASAGNLLLLQNESVDRFRVDAAGNVYVAGTIASTGTLTSGGVNVCLQDGSNCPATLTGGGTANFVTKFTGTGDTVGNSLIQDDGANIGLGGAPNASYMARVYGGLYADSVSASTVSTYLVAAGATGVVGQVVGTGSTGVTGSGGSYGVYGTSGGYGVYGYNTSAGGTGAGVYGYGSGTSPGVQGNSASGWGGSFSSLYVTPGTSYFASSVTLNGGATLGANAGLTLGTGGADIAGANGRMFYNTTTNKFRCYENGAWRNCTDGAVASVTGSGAGISVAPTTGAVVVQNTGVTSAVAGAGISLSGGTGAVTITNTGDTNAADDITGSGTANYLPKFTGAQALGNSLVYDSGAGVGIGTASPSNLLHVSGGSDLTGAGTGGVVRVTQGGSVYTLMDENEIQSFNGGAPGFLHINQDGGTLVLTGGAAGQVGIGTSSPSNKLTVAGDADFVGSVGIGTTTPSYPLDVNGRAFFNGEIAVGGDISSVWTGYGVASSGTTAGGHFYNTNYASVYGALGYASSGNRYGLYARAQDATGTTNYAAYLYASGAATNYAVYAPSGLNYFAGTMGVGTTPVSYSEIYAYGGSDAYAFIARDTGTGNGKGIMAYGQYYGGYFRDTDSLATLYAGWGGYGAYGLGSTAGGYFSGTAGGAAVYVGYGSSYGLYVGSGNTYGVFAYGNSTAGRFYDVDGTATTFIAGASWGVEIITGGAVKPGGGSWSSSSDRRVKKDVADFTDGLSVIREMNPVSYTYNGLGDTPEGLKGIGFIAQDVEKVAPYLIQREKKKLHPDDEEETEILLVDPSSVPFINMNAIQELDLEITGLEARVTERQDAAERRIEELERRVRDLERRLEE